jgi:hypothetical protein
MAVRMIMFFFWVFVPCILVGIYQQVYVVPKPRRTASAVISFLLIFLLISMKVEHISL